MKSYVRVLFLYDGFLLSLRCGAVIAERWLLQLSVGKAVGWGSGASGRMVV